MKYKVTLAINGEEYDGEGKTIAEAIDDTGLRFTDVKTKGTITIKDGEYEIQKFFLARQIKKLFNSSLVRKFWPNDMEKMFKIMKEKKLFKKEIGL